jgi:phosphomannomutase/phosphoglucomutase
MGDLFGTNGVRGVVGDRMTPQLALDIGKAVGSHVEVGDRVLVGRDTRTSGPALESAVVSGLLSTGVEVDRAGVVPTPALQHAVKKRPHRRGVVVTASHNPPEFNGIKVVYEDGRELPRSVEDEVEAIYFDQSYRTADWDRLSAPGQASRVNERYVDAVVDGVDAGTIAEADLDVVLDGSNGAGAEPTAAVLRELGVHPITLNCQPDGTFPGHESEPTPENLADLQDTVPAVDADLGIAVDGDADRAVFVTGEGAFVPGEVTLTLVAGRVAEEHGGGTVVTPVSTSSALEEHVEERGGGVEYTAVGSPVVAKRMVETDAVFGGEENGGLMFPDHVHVRDGAMAAAKILEIVAQEGRSLKDLVAEIPTKALVKESVDCPEALKEAFIDAYGARERDGEVVTVDGVKVVTDEGWTLVRPSGTEPIVRVYGEADERSTAQALVDEARGEVEDLVADLRKG